MKNKIKIKLLAGPDTAFGREYRITSLSGAVKLESPLHSRDEERCFRVGDTIAERVAECFATNPSYDVVIYC